MAIYYVDGDRPDDTGDGTTPETAWKTIGKAETESANMVAGDSLLFKRDQTFEGSFEYGGASGTLGNEVVIASYGTGARPIITTIEELTGTWSDEGSNKWSMPTSVTMLSRLWKDGVEKIRASPVSFGHTWEEFGLLGGVIWAGDSNKVYYYSIGEPSGVFTGTLAVNTITIDSKSYINLSDLDLRGGNNHALTLVSSTYINVSYSNIGKYSAYGIVLSSSCSNLLIERNIFDSDYKLTWEGVNSYSGVDARGCNDGLVSWDAASNSEIRYNNFINWAHGGISFNTSANLLTLINVHHNFITTPDLLYGRGIDLSGTNINNNEIHYNYMQYIAVRNQWQGQTNHYHHNVIDEVIDSPYKDGGEGQGIMLEAWVGAVTGNTYEYNTISNTDDAGFELTISGDDISGNILHKNEFINCGRNAAIGSGERKGIRMADSAYFDSNTFTDNAFVDNTDNIYHRNVVCTVAEFNARDGQDGDTITGNVVTVTDQGANLSLSEVGVDAPLEGYPLVTIPWSVKEICDGVTYIWNSDGQLFIDGAEEAYTPPSDKLIMIDSVQAKPSISVIERTLYEVHKEIIVE